MKKNTISLFILTIMILVLSGCNKNSSEEVTTTIEANTTSIETESIDIGITDMSSLTYTQSFKTLIEKMKIEYGIAEYKGIDFDEFYNEMKDSVQEAEDNNDETAYYQVLFQLKNLLFEVHASVKNYEASQASLDYFAGNDYGLSLITKTDGNTVAIMIEEGSQAEKAGIKTGTVITKWDGQDIEEIKKDITVVYPNLTVIPDAESEEIYKAFMVAGKGGDLVTVNYIDENGDEQEITLDKIGGYSERLNNVLALFLYLQKNKNQENLSWKILQGNQGYIYIGSEDSNMTSEVESKITEAVNVMKEEKVTSLIIDLRSNLGGDPEFSKIVASLFATKTIDIASEGEIKPDCKWKDVNIVVLVNADTISSGDLLTYSLGQLDNVTLMGLTTSNSSFGMPNGDLQITPNMTFSYPIAFRYNTDGSYFIDPGADRNSCIDLDAQIPIDDELIQKLFVDKTDYELQYCCDYIDKTFGKNEVTRDEVYEPVDENEDSSVWAYLGFMNELYTISYWNDGKDYSPVVSNGVEITGEGDYTVSLDFTGLGSADSTVFCAVMIDNCEAAFPGGIITINSIKVNDKDIDIQKGYTTSDDGKCTRCNIINPWVTSMPNDARTLDGNIDDTSPYIADAFDLSNMGILEVNFSFDIP